MDIRPIRTDRFDTISAPIGAYEQRQWPMLHE